MAIGNASKMIDSGSWQTSPQPKLPKSYKEYNTLFRFGFLYQGFKFICEYLEDKETKDLIWYIYPYYKDFEDNFIVFSDEIKPNKYWQTNIYDISIKNEKLRNLFMSFKEDKIFFSNDLCRHRF